MFKGLATALLLAAAAAAQNSTGGSDMVINTPASIVVCQPAQITWTGGTGPYYVNVLPGGQPSGTPIEALVNGVNENSFTWNVNLAADTQITLSLKDSTGKVVYSGTSTIQAGTDTSCVNATAPAGSGGAASTGGAAGSSNTAGGAASNTAGGAASSAAATDKSTATGSAAASASSEAKSGAGVNLNIPVALTVVGAAVAALL